MNKRIVRNNIKNTFFFSYSIVFSTIFFVTYLGLKNECKNIENEIQELQYSKLQQSNRIKSLKRHKNLLVQSVEEIAHQDYGFVIPDPEPLVIIMDNR